MKYLMPFSVLKNSIKLIPIKGQLKIDMSYDEFMECIKKLLNAVVVDEHWYRTTYPDVDEAIKSSVYRSARQHFVENGYFEGRFPFKIKIDESWYIKQYPDVEISIKLGTVNSALDHFEQNGYEEGRIPAEEL